MLRDYAHVRINRHAGCSLVQAAATFSDSALFGKKLDCDQSLQHPLLSQFWQVVDIILIEDPTVREHVYGGYQR